MQGSGAIEEENAAFAFLQAIKRQSQDVIKLPPDQKGLSTRKAWGIVQAQLSCGEWPIAEMLSAETNIQVAEDLDSIDPEVLRSLPFRVAQSLNVLPIKTTEQGTVVATSNPFDKGLQEQLRFSLNGNFHFVIAPPNQIDNFIAQAYSAIAHETAAHSGYLSLDNVKRSGALQKKTDDVPLLVRLMMVEAIEQGASDLHLQTVGGGFAARLRIDGMLRRLVFLPGDAAQAAVRYVKAQANMDPTNHIIPQDGRMTLKRHGHEYDLRISTLPISHGTEKLVIRFLNRQANYRLSKLGMSLDEIHSLRRMASNPSGIVLLCGPTGSGKTTTLYSLLAEINSESISIATVENPVEYEFPGIAQSEIHEKSGMTFARALRAILRQDPDVILIGEIRDAETADIAIQSALTGHLVFSTLHTRGSFSAIPRLVDLGIDPKVLSESLVGVVSQRLLRRLCENCREPGIEGTQQPEERIFQHMTNMRPPYRARGCKECQYTGYLGRFVITEFFEVTADLIDAIAENSSSEHELQDSVGDRFRSLSSGAVRRILSGDTSVEEVARILGRRFWIDLAAEYQAAMPEPDDFESGLDMPYERGSGVLLLTAAGFNENYSQAFTSALEHGWYKLYRAETPEEAKKLVKENDSISIIVGTVDSDMDEEELSSLVGEYSVALAWTRLPTLIFLPPERMFLEDKLLSEGHLLRFLPKNVSVEAKMLHINLAVAHHLDFRWK